MAAFEKMQLTDETPVLFTADNGPEGDGLGDPKNPAHSGTARAARPADRAAANGPTSREAFAPGIVRWPGHQVGNGEQRPGDWQRHLYNSL
ncbi:MAG: hypothetical protein R3B91_08620 [Planctomycetaceae bacterium]